MRKPKARTGYHPGRVDSLTQAKNSTGGSQKQAPARRGEAVSGQIGDGLEPKLLECARVLTRLLDRLALAYHSLPLPSVSEL